MTPGKVSTPFHFQGQTPHLHDTGILGPKQCDTKPRMQSWHKDPQRDWAQIPYPQKYDDPKTDTSGAVGWSKLHKFPRRVCQQWEDRGRQEWINSQSVYSLILSSETCSISDGCLNEMGDEDGPWARSRDRMIDSMVSTSWLSRSFPNCCDNDWIRRSEKKARLELVTWKEKVVRTCGLLER